MLNQQNNYQKPPVSEDFIPKNRPFVDPEAVNPYNTEYIQEYRRAINWEPIMEKPYDQRSPVEKKQIILKSMGYYLDKIDGIMGPNTRAATKDLQKDLQRMKLYDGQIDGIWGPKLDKAVDEFYSLVG